MRNKNIPYKAVKIALVYLIIGMLYIVFSDMLVVAVFSDPEQVNQVQTYKGIVFVFITCLILYILISKEFKKQEKNHRLVLESEDRFRGIFKNANIGIALYDSAGSLYDANEEFCNMLAYSKKELIGMNYIRFTHPDDLEKEKLLSEKIRTNELDKYRIEKRYINSEGNILWVDVAVTGQKDSEGKLMQFIGMAMDITERKKTIEELSKIAKLESLGIIAGGIAHNFKNLLTSMSFSVDIAKKKPQTVSKHLDKIGRSIEQATALATRFQTFSKSGEPILTPSNINSIINEAVELAITGAKTKISLELSDDVPEIQVDCYQLNEAFTNLLINAEQAMPDGGCITVRTRLEYIESHTDSNILPGDYIAVDIIDDGTGIAPHHMKDIYTPFFTTKENGHGLGLASVYHIIEKHNGAISVHSEIEKGTTFTVYLPVS